MLRKRREYQQLEDTEYVITKQPSTKLLLVVIIVLKLVLLSIWGITVLYRSEEEGSLLINRQNFFEQENLVILEAEELENRVPIWESKTKDSKCSIYFDEEKFDCHPEKGGNAESCTQRGCCWEPKTENEPGVPWCYYPQNYEGYKVVNITHTKNSLRIYIARNFSSPYPDDVKLAKIDVQYQTDYRIHIKISDAESNRYEPPYPEIPILQNSRLKDPLYRFLPTSKGFKIFRKNGFAVFDSNHVGAFIFADQFLQMSIRFEGKIYGIGEHQTSLELNTNWTKFTLFNRDGIPQPDTNLYGSHPFYMVLEPNGSSHGVFFHNSNAMDVVLQPLPAITFRSIGGIFDFYVFLGPTPADVIKQYTEIIGRPFMPPYWSLGFHLSRLGHKNTSAIRKVWQRTRAAGIPFDTQWHDIDYMHKRNDFTYDRHNYGDLPKFVEEIHDAGMYYVPIIDPGISACEPKGTYTPYSDGVIMNIFVKNLNGSIFIGKVWNPKCTAFPDFTALSAATYWSRQFKKYYKMIPYDGVWIDMNEPSNFVDGSIDGCPPSKWESPPFVPNVAGGKLNSLTLCMSAVHAAGLHYNVHNLYGISEARATYRALLNLGKRPFIISRSTYPGIGKFAGHWSGDVTSTWESMKATIPKMLSFSLFGVPMMGADICGFNGNTTAMLCQRWSQLGAFYPFSRNHNSDDCIDQDPVALGKNVVKSARKALIVRYSLLPYLYTLFFKAHTEGETVARPLFFEFWEDPRTHNIDESFLWGCCILIAPVLKEYATTVTTYLPAGRWYNFYTGLGLESNGTDVVLSAPSHTIPILVRGGAIIPIQSPDVTTELSRKNNIILLVAPNKTMHASGCLFWDDGKSIDVLKTGMYGFVTFTLTPNNLTSHINYWEYRKVLKLSVIKIVGFIKPIQSLYFNNTPIKFNWSPTSLILSVFVKHQLHLPFVITWRRDND